MGDLDPQIAGNDDRSVGSGFDGRVRSRDDVRGAESRRSVGSDVCEGFRESEVKTNKKWGR